jgi:SAM-dependent methyltransferase
MEKKPSKFTELSLTKHQDYSEIETTVATRFNRQYQNKDLELPEEVKSLPIYQEWVTGILNAKIASPFWEIQLPRKNQRCLDIGCGVSFLIYPWREWEALFSGQEISTVARDTLNSRGPQLNSKLFKGVALGSALQLQYDRAQFDLAIATGWSCYYPLDYWVAVMEEVKRILKGGGSFVFDVLNSENPLALDWAVLETYLGAEVFLESKEAWKRAIASVGAKVDKQLEGELFDLYKVHFLESVL